jgi:hypothetical protein
VTELGITSDSIFTPEKAPELIEVTELGINISVI